jgi:hypothetical protein
MRAGAGVDVGGSTRDRGFHGPISVRGTDLGGSPPPAISVSWPRRTRVSAAYRRRMVGQPEPTRPPQPEPAPPEQPGPASDAAEARVAYLPIGLVFLVLGFSGLFNDTLRHGAIAFLPVGFVFLVLALQGRSDDDAESGDAGQGASDADRPPAG